MNLHIATLGKEIGHIMSSFKHYRIDKMLIITSNKYEEQAKEVEEKLNYFKIEVDIVKVDPFVKESYTNIIDEILTYVKNFENTQEIYFNITGGTNLMTSASLSAAQLLGANAYYAMIKDNKDVFLDVPIMRVSLKDTLSEKQKKIFNIIHKEISKHGDIKNLNKFSEDYGLYKQKLRFYLQIFEKLNLIEINKTDREHTLKLTETGKLIKQLL